LEVVTDTTVMSLVFERGATELVHCAITGPCLRMRHRSSARPVYHSIIMLWKKVAICRRAYTFTVQAVWCWLSCIGRPALVQMALWCSPRDCYWPRSGLAVRVYG